MIKGTSSQICKNYSVQFEVGSIKGSVEYQVFVGLNDKTSEERFYCDIDVVIIEILNLWECL